MRRKDKILVEIIKAHQKYVDWWLPIDMDNDFLTEEAKVYDKRSVLDLLRQHSLKWIDLNNMTSNLEEHKKWVENRTELR